jgi:hypothetical protein
MLLSVNQLPLAVWVSEILARTRKETQSGYRYLNTSCQSEKHEERADA